MIVNNAKNLIGLHAHLLHEIQFMGRKTYNKITVLVLKKCAFGLMCIVLLPVQAELKRSDRMDAWVHFTLVAFYA